MIKRSPWILVLAITSIWHFSRGAYGDGLVFGVGALVLELDKRGIRKLLPKQIRVSKSLLTILVLLIWVTLTISTRYGVLDLLVLYLIGCLVFLSAWHPDFGKRKFHDAASRRAAKYWSWLALVVCGIELLSYMFASKTKDDYQFPTLTVLVDPWIDHLFGRAIFNAIWLAIGLRLIRPKVSQDNS